MMTNEQRQQCPDIYRRLLYATLKPGQSAWAYGEFVRKPIQPVSGMPVFTASQASKTSALGQVA